MAVEGKGEGERKKMEEGEEEGGREIEDGEEPRGSENHEARRSWKYDSRVAGMR